MAGGELLPETGRLSQALVEFRDSASILPQPVPGVAGAARAARVSETPPKAKVHAARLG